MSHSKGIASKKDLDAFVTRMAAGRKAAKERKAAAPNPPSPNRNTVVGKDTRLPKPAMGGTGPGARELHIHVHMKD